jgi:carbamoyltransferase
MSNDAGTAIGAAFLMYHQQTQSINVLPYADSVYLGPAPTHTTTEIHNLVEEYKGAIKEVTYKEVVDILRKKNIVTIFQGRSENGPRALGNRSILFDPTFKDGKDFVNAVKHREYFRPFAGTVLAEHAEKWFDMCGLKQSPHMMYAVDCLPGVAEKIPSIIHVDGTCRIQTVTRKQNLHFYNLIEEFYKQTNVPILFNTSFNLGGDPLVETLEDAVNTLSRSDIEYLYLPEHSLLITIPNNTTSGKVKKYQIS